MAAKNESIIKKLKITKYKQLNIIVKNKYET